jgi:hypothetical protein
MTRRKESDGHSSVPAPDPDWERRLNGEDQGRGPKPPAPPQQTLDPLEEDPDVFDRPTRPYDVHPLAFELDEPSFEREPDSLLDVPPLSLSLPPLVSDTADGDNTVPATADLLRRMRDKQAAGDYSGALDCAEQLLATDPGEEEASRCRLRCRDVLTQMLTARLSPLSQRPEVAVAASQLRWLSLDHRAGFVLSLVDGSSSVDEILDASGMPRLEALKLVVELVSERLIVLRPSRQ